MPESSLLKLAKFTFEPLSRHIHQTWATYGIHNCAPEGVDKYHETVRFGNYEEFHHFIVFSSLQDQCEPTPYEAVNTMFQSDMGKSINELFVDFDPKPVGVASLAQVHVASLRETGEKVAVKVCRPTQPNLRSFS